MDNYDASINSSTENITAPVNTNKNRKIIIIGLILLILILVPVTMSLMSGKAKEPLPAISPTPVIVSPTITISPLKKGVDVILFKDKETKVPDTNVKLKLLENSIPAKNCFDCISFTNIEIKTNQGSKILEYPCGGIAGNCVRKLQYTEFNFELVKSISEDQVILKVSN